MTETERLAAIEAIASTFASRLAQVIGPERLAEVVKRNADDDNPSVCHSHDFCDANMTMAGAFDVVMQREVDMHSDADLALWNDAWERARVLFAAHC